jgi:hypothetical protein
VNKPQQKWWSPNENTPMDIDPKKKEKTPKNRKVIVDKKVNQTNKKIADEVMETVILVKMKDLLKMKGNEVKKEFKQRMKEQEAKVGLVRGERRTRPLIAVNINGSILNALCDTGADVSTMSQDVFEQLELQKESSKIRIKGITSQDAKNFGRSRQVPIQVFGEEIPIDMEIIGGEDLFILGRDWMKQAGVIVNNPSEEVIFNWENEIKIPFKADGNENDTEEEDDD